jgi:hypothetical protein
LTWPEDEERTRSRVTALVTSVVRNEELREIRVEASSRSLWLTVVAGDNEFFEGQIWTAHLEATWEQALEQLCSDMEDWVCETRFAWGQLRHATYPL